MSLIYCYGVIDKKIQLDVEGAGKSKISGTTLRGFEKQKVHAIQFKDIRAVVSNVSEEDFSQEVIDKNVKDIRWLAENGQIHEDVVDSIMKITTVIPMKFCTIFKTKKNVESMLEERYADFKFNLKNLRDRAEIGVKVYFDAEPLKKKVLEESSEIKELEKEASAKKPGAAYFVKQKIDILLNEKVRQKLAEDAKNIFGDIKTLAEDSKQNELLNKKLTKKDMLLNAVFLIKKSEIGKFKSGIGKIKSNYSNMEFEVWGPFPPYNFIR